MAELENTRLKIGKDKIRFNLQSAKSGYVYLLNFDARHASLSLLFPNQFDKKNSIQADKNFTVPRPGWNWIAEGPEGTDRILVIVSESPRKFDHIGFNKTGDLSLEAAKEAFDKHKGSEPLFAGIPSCKSEPKCSNAYSAKILTVDLIN